MAFKSKVIVALALAMLLMAPVAMAGHFTLVRADRDTGGNTGMWASIATWTEDERAEAMASAAPAGLANLAEVITASGATAGDGSLVLDARYVAAPANANFGSSHFTRPATNDRDTITPGIGSFMAWYGFWDDKANAGIIDEYQAALADIRDEFLWHGAADDHGGMTMVSWVYPSNPHAGCRPPAAIALNTCRDNVLDREQGIRLEAGLRTLGALEDPQRQRPDFSYADRTDGEAPGDEAWLAESGWMTTFIDESLIMKTWVMTIANATISAGSGTVYATDPVTPASDWRRDVDEYEVLSNEVNELYVNNMADVRAAYLFANQAYIVPLSVIVSDATRDLEGPMLGTADDHVWPGFGFDGVGGDDGDFTGGWDWFLQVRLHNARPTPAVVAPQPVGQVGPWGFATHTESPLTGCERDPATIAAYVQANEALPPCANGGDRALVSGFVNAQIRAGLFFDRDQDGWIGNGCDHEKENGDVGQCTDPYRYGLVDDPNDYTGEGYSGEEFIPDCGPARQAVVFVQPAVGEEWPAGSFKKNMWNRLLGAHWAGEPTLVPLENRDIAELPMDTAVCSAADSLTYSRDALFLGTGSQLVTLDAWVDVTFPTVFDEEAGLDVDSVSLRATARYVPSL